PRFLARWQLVAAGSAAVVVLLGIFLRAGPNYGSIKIEIIDPNLTVQVDRNEFTIPQLDKPLILRAGKHGLTVKRDGRVVVSREFEIQSGDNDPLSVTIAEPPKAEVQPGRAAGGSESKQLEDLLVEGSVWK